MMKKCWDVDPLKRPTTQEIFDFAYYYLNNLHKRGSSNNEIIVPSSNSNDNDNNSQQIQKLHPLAYHSSRILDDDIAIYKSLQYDLELDSVSEVICDVNVD